MTPDSFETESEQISAAIGFCRAENMYDLETADAWRCWLSGNIDVVLTACIDRNMPDAVRYFAVHRLIGQQDHSRALEKAQKARTMEIVALLLDYRSSGLKRNTFFEQYEL